MNKRQSQPIYKVILIGDTRVGKTSFLNQLIQKSPAKQHPPTIGVQYATKYIRCRNSNREFKSQIWDTSGAEKYQSITSSYYRKSQGAILMFDVTDKNTFDNIKKWLAAVRKYSEKNIALQLVANKIDLVQSYENNRMVSEAEITSFCMENQLTYKQTSAKTGYNVGEVFEEILERIHQTTLQEQPHDMSSMIRLSWTSEQSLQNKKQSSDGTTLEKIEEQKESQMCPRCC